MFDFLGSLGSGIGKAFDFASDLGSAAWGGIQNLGSSLLDFGQDTFGGLFGGGGSLGGGGYGGMPGGTGQGGFDLGTLASLGYQWFSQNQQSKQLEELYKRTARQADPFGKYKPQVAEQLMELLTNPNTIASSPSYGFRMRQGEEALNRKLAASGYRLSGNQMQALTTYGQQFASTEYENEVERLRRLLEGTGGADVLSKLGMTGIQAKQGRDATVGQILGEVLGGLGK